jgi:hypothetical protein
MSFRFVLLLLAAAVAVTAQDHSLGYDNTPYLPGTKWRVHDISRPHPPLVTPGAENSAPPSDAIVLFNGKDLSQWVTFRRGEQMPPKWKVENGYVEVVDGTGSINTKEKFGDVQLHIEWASPAEIKGSSQDRGNSGVLFMGRYEVQVLDSYENPTYADGQAASIYGQYPPLVNASKKPGEWQTYDIVFEAPRFDGDKLLKPAYITVFQNGVLVQNHEQLFGDTPHAKLGTYKPHAAEESLQLQNHHCAVRYRNIWIRRLQGRP